MNTVDWIGYVVAVGICLLLGWWLRRVNRKQEDGRIESLAIGFGWFVLGVVLAGKLAA